MKSSLGRNGWRISSRVLPERADGNHASSVVGQIDRGILYMAGIYRLEKGVPVFTILIRSPADSIVFIHGRMPVILPDEAKADWLNPKYAADDLIRHAAAEVQFRMA